MNKSFFALFFAFTVLCGAAHASYIRTGTYELLGSNSDTGNVNYRGYVSITARGDNYDLAWVIGSKQVQIGTGILMNDVLSVCYCDITKEKMGVVSFKIISNGELWGKWAPIGSSSYGIESLNWVSY
jgi:hypothetical protein